MEIIEQELKPCMSEKEINCIKKYIKDAKNMLEWGSGGSTVFFSALVDKYCSIEHDKAWFDKVKNYLESNNIDNVEYYLSKNCEGVLNSYRAMPKHEQHNYIKLVDKFNIKRFDAVLVDGMARANCAKEALSFIDEESIVIIHDYYHWYETQPEWPAAVELHDLFNSYDIIDKVEEGQSLIVLRRK